VSIASPPPTSVRTPADRPAEARPTLRWVLIGGSAIAFALVAFAAAVLAWSGAQLKPDDTALARVTTQMFGGTITRAQAFGPDGHTIPLGVHAGRLTPRVKLTPGERISIAVTVRRPSSLGWAIGSERHERLTIRAPVAHVRQRWITVGGGGTVRIALDRPVAAVAYGPIHAGSRKTLATPRAILTLDGRQTVGATAVSVAARTWERLAPPVTVSWFPRASGPVAVASPSPGAHLSPATPLRLTFAQPVDQALGATKPAFSPAVPGRWSEPDSHTLQFTPSGLGAGFAADEHLRLPRAVVVTGPSGGALRTTRDVDWKTLPGSTTRLQQLLADAGYLPVQWSPAGRRVARTLAAQVRAAVDPPPGSFDWRYPNTPPELRRQWTAGQPSEITRGAVMKFQNEHKLTVDAVAGRAVWRALLADEIAGRRQSGGYSYVYVHRNVPQKLTLWHNGHTVITSPGNTGIPAAPTDLGTFPVFEHLAVTTMSGTNPDGSHYDDPGIKWVSYFNGGDALHSFPRASFGTPQSLGCVELPLATAAKVWPYTPIGTLVTIEN
jgi:peptidoglycan hydrolase-like protein with peptidoglycan-binding domain